MASSTASSTSRRGSERLVVKDGRRLDGRYQPLIVVAAALTVGIVLDRFGPVYPQPAVAGSFPLTAVRWWGPALGSWAVWLGLRRCHRDRVAALALLSAIIVSGATWHQLRWETFPRAELGRFAPRDGTPVCLEAIAIQRPIRLPAPPFTPFRAIPQGERSRLPLRVVQVRDGTQWTPACGVTQLTVDGHLLGVRAGDRLRVFGQLHRIRPPSNPGEYDAADNARAQHRLTSLISGSPDCVRVVQEGSRWTLARTLDDLRTRAERMVWRYVDPGIAPLATALLLGDRSGVPWAMVERYRVTGTIHLLVVSGLHVGIVAAGLFAAKWSGWLPRRASLVAIITVVLLYTLVTGSNPPVVRAAVLTVLICVAAWTGRSVVALNSLAAAAILVLAINPCDLFRVGPQLSFLAVATLIWVGGWILHYRRGAATDPLRRLIEQSRPWPIRFGRTFLRWNLAIVAATTAVWLVALPLVMNRMHVVSPVAVVISPVVWPLVTVALSSGLGVVVGAVVFPPLADCCGVVCTLSLRGLEGLVGAAEQVPGGHFWVAGPADWWVVGFYVGVVWITVAGGRRLAARWRVALLCIWIIAGLIPPLVAASYSRDRLECRFLALGHGICVCLHAPGGQTLLYDAGSLSSPNFAAQTVASYLWDRGVHRIDGIVLSHADVDHFNALPELAERFTIGAVYLSPVMFDGFDASTSDASAPRTLERMLREQYIPIHEIWSGDRLRLGSEVVIDVLHPPRRGVLGSDNANSITLGVRYAGRRLLLPGDLESPGLESVLAELPYDCDVLLAPHHGSRRSDPPGFAAWCTPEWVVISGGGTPGAEAVEETYRRAGAQVFHTDRDGAVEVSITSGGRIAVSSWRQQHGRGISIRSP